MGSERVVLVLSLEDVLFLCGRQSDCCSCAAHGLLRFTFLNLNLGRSDGFRTVGLTRLQVDTIYLHKSTSALVGGLSVWHGLPAY